MQKSMKLFAMAIVVAVLSGGAMAATDWPNKAVTFIIPFSPGGGVDQTLLPLKPMLEKKLNQPFLYSYKKGASGRIGWEIAHSKGTKGYAITALVLPHLVNTTIFAKPKYKFDDITPVAVITGDVPIWFTHKDSAYNNMKDLVADAKKRPGQVTLAIGSFTGEHYIGVALLEQQLGIRFRKVNVKGGSKVMSNVVGKHFDVGVSRPTSILRVRPDIKGLGIVSAKKSALYPEAETFDSQLPASKIPHMRAAFGIAAHKSFKENDPEGFAKLVNAVKEALHSAEYQAALKRGGREFTYMGPEEGVTFVAGMHAAMLKYKPLIDAAKKSKKKK